MHGRRVFCGSAVRFLVSCLFMHKYRQSDINRNLRLRARIIQAIRKFFIERNYLEVETPVRIPAPAPEAQSIL